MAEAVEQTNTLDHDSVTEDDGESFLDVNVARDGINMLLNNKFDDAFKLFEARKYVWWCTVHCFWLILFS